VHILIADDEALTRNAEAALCLVRATLCYDDGCNDRPAERKPVWLGWLHDHYGSISHENQDLHKLAECQGARPRIFE
jgi:hypothetical protein